MEQPLEHGKERAGKMSKMVGKGLVVFALVLFTGFLIQKFGPVALGCYLALVFVAIVFWLSTWYYKYYKRSEMDRMMHYDNHS